MLIYLAGPYSSDPEGNTERAAAIAAELWRAGHAVICPHTNSHLVSEFAPEITHRQWLDGDLNMIARVDAMVMMESWRDSKGAVEEHTYASSLGMPIYYAPDLPALHITEVRCPEQAQAFREFMGRMYRTHLSKNADYSPANILATGEIGLATRLWDKIARLMNLLGFRFDINPDSVRFETPRAPKNESIDDTLIDAAVYAVIGALLRKGKWGR
jgi:nucleoside 2-deoxyribosyltransferase